MARLRKRPPVRAQAADEFVIPPEFADVAPPQDYGPPAPPGYTEDAFGNHNPPDIHGPEAPYGPYSPEYLGRDPVFPDQHQPGYTQGPPTPDRPDFGPWADPDAVLFPDQDMAVVPFPEDAGRDPSGWTDGGGWDGGSGFDWGQAGRLVGRIVDVAGKVVEVAVRRSEPRDAGAQRRPSVQTGVYLLEDGTLWVQFDHETPPRGARRMRMTPKGWTPEDGRPIPERRPGRDGSYADQDRFPDQSQPGYTRDPGRGPAARQEVRGDRRGGGTWVWVLALALLGLGS